MEAAERLNILEKDYENLEKEKHLYHAESVNL
jgi:hypothetical protein